MASGFGLAGGPSRCLPFWQEVLACYVVNANAEDGSGKAKCYPALEDYFECLYHRKEAAKISALQAAYRKRESETPRSEAPSAGQIRSLGLIEASNAEKDIKHGDMLPKHSDNQPRGAGGKAPSG